MALNAAQNPQWAVDDLSEVARWQKYISWLILIQIADFFLLIGVAVFGTSSAQPGGASDLVSTGLVLLLYVGSLVAAVLCVYSAYKLASALRMSAAIVCAVAMLIPLLALIMLVVLSSNATQLLQRNGIRVGLMGASQEDVRRACAEQSAKLSA